MFDETSEISETLEWMLQSRQVGDETLVKTLVHEQYAPIYRFAQSVLNSTQSKCGKSLTEQVILAAVEEAHKYPGNVDVQVWLFNLTFKNYEQNRGLDLSRTFVTHVGETYTEKGNKTQVISDWIDALRDEMRISITLEYLYGFTEGQIAQVINAPESLITDLLAGSKKYWMGQRNRAAHLDVGERDIIAALIERWPKDEIDKNDEEQISRRILLNLGEKERRKHRIVILGEAVLVILAIMLVAGMGRMISVLTPEPTSQLVYETRLVNQIVYVSPTPNPTQPATPFPEKAVLYQAVGGETLGEVAEKIFFNSRILEALNNIPADQPLKAGQRVMIGVRDSQVIMPTLTSPSSTPESTQPIPYALNLQASDADIRQRILDGREYWNTLWADALVIQFGPPGYVGEPEFRRQQIWIDQPYFTYVLDGTNGGEVEYIYSAVGGWENLVNTQTGKLLSNVGPQSLNYRPNLQHLLFNSEFQEDFSGEIEIVRQDLTAGREVLVLDWYLDEGLMRGSGFESERERILHGRYWVDIHLGLVLRAQKFSGNATNHLFEETIVSNVQFNVPIPRRLYDRSQYVQTYFARDHTGDYVLEPLELPEDTLAPPQGQEDLLYLSPPSDFAINNSQLSVHWTSLSRFNPEQGTTADLFADGYYLGNVEFTEPEQLICTRSPDGSIIAFSSWSNEVDYGFTPLGWINLSKLPEVHYFNPEFIPNEFAFSPDNQQLAVYGCQRYGEQACGIYLIELDSGSAWLLRLMEQGAELIWSPDGKKIAIQGSFLREGRWRVLVLDSKSGNLIYDGPFDWEGFSMASGSPIHDWGVPYPPLRGGLEVCSQPPQGE